MDVQKQTPSSDRVSLSTWLPLMTTGCCECFLRHLKLLVQYNERRYLEALVCRTNTICIDPINKRVNHTETTIYLTTFKPTKVL